MSGQVNRPLSHLPPLLRFLFPLGQKDVSKHLMINNIYGRLLQFASKLALCHNFFLFPRGQKCFNKHLLINNLFDKLRREAMDCIYPTVRVRPLPRMNRCAAQLVTTQMAVSFHLCREGFLG